MHSTTSREAIEVRLLSPGDLAILEQVDPDAFDHPVLRLVNPRTEREEADQLRCDI